MAFAFCSFAVAGSGCPDKRVKKMDEKRIAVLLETASGNIKIELYNETSGHRDNFIKNVKAGAYDGVLFHRVIKDFMIQTGDPSSKTAKSGEMLGASDFGNEFPGEFIYPKYFHKKGAVAAARTSDAVNPEKKSSGSQFYIVTGKVCKEQELVAMEKSMQNKQRQTVFDALVGERRKEIMDLRRSRDTLGLQELQEKLLKMTEDSLRNELFHFTQEQKLLYTTIGGTPFLDGSYSVFGEVVEGLDVVDAIQLAETDRNDRPKNDIRILKATIVE